MLSFSAAVSPELRALMEKARTIADGMRNVNLTPSEQVWSRQLHCMLSLGMHRQILLYHFGELAQPIDRIEQFRHLVRKYEEESGESVTDNVRQAVFQAAIKDASIRDQVALHAGGLDSFDEMATEVSTVARTRNETDVVPMDFSVLKGKGGKGKEGKGKGGKTKDGKGKAKVKDDKDKTDSKSKDHGDKKTVTRSAT